MSQFASNSRFNQMRNIRLEDSVRGLLEPTNNCLGAMFREQRGRKTGNKTDLIGCASIQLVKGG